MFGHARIRHPGQFKRLLRQFRLRVRGFREVGNLWRAWLGEFAESGTFCGNKNIVVDIGMVPHEPCRIVGIGRSSKKLRRQSAPFGCLDGSLESIRRCALALLTNALLSGRGNFVRLRHFRLYESKIGLANGLLERGGLGSLRDLADFRLRFGHTGRTIFKLEFRFPLRTN